MRRVRELLATTFLERAGISERRSSVFVYGLSGYGMISKVWTAEVELTGSLKNGRRQLRYAHLVCISSSSRVRACGSV